MAFTVIEHKKNDIFYLAIPAITASDRKVLATGETITLAIYYKDGSGSWTSHSVTDSFSQIDSTGMYEITLTAAEMNHDQILMKMTSTNMEAEMVLFNCRSALAEDVDTYTSQLTFSASGNVDANVAEINDTTVQGVGESGNKWRPT